MSLHKLTLICEAFKNRNYSVIAKLLFNVFLLIVILIAIYTAFSISLVERSLWIDEAMTAYSFSQRSLSNLTSDIFEWHQPAPIIYLYIVKIITVIFGNTEFTLRVWSFVMYICTIGVSYYILAKVLKVKFPLIGTAFIANLSFLIQTSNIFKVYISDCFSITFIIAIYYLYKEKRIGKIALAIIFATLIWYSNPACFFIAAILLYECVESLSKKDYPNVRYIILCGLAVGISFIIYYFYWLKPEIDTGFMAEYWKGNRFPLIPTSMSDIVTIRLAIHHISSYLSTYNQILLWVVVACSFISFFIEKNRYTNIMYIGIFIGLFASMLGFYPIQDRLWLFIYPLIIILFFYYLNKLYTRKVASYIVLSIISVLIIFSGKGISHYSDRENIRNELEEINPAIEYVRNHITENEKLFVYHPSIAGFCYKNEYNKASFAGFDNNVLLGKELFIGKTDTESIINNSPVYILATYPERIVNLIDTLNKEGSLKLVYNENNTHVYLYTSQ